MLKTQYILPTPLREGTGIIRISGKGISSHCKQDILWLVVRGLCSKHANPHHKVWIIGSESGEILDECGADENGL